MQASQPTVGVKPLLEEGTRAISSELIYKSMSLFS